MTLECRTAELFEAAATDDMERVAFILDEEKLISARALQWTPRRLAPTLSRYWAAWGQQPGACALHCAAEAGSASAVSALIARGAAPDQTTRHGVSALHLAAFGGHSSIVSLLLAEPAVDVRRVCNDFSGVGGPSALHLACCADNARAGADCAALLLAGGADVNAIDRTTGWSALHYAVMRGNAQACRRLVSAGAWVKLADSLGSSPLSLAYAAVRNGDAAAGEVISELRWTPAVRILWLGQLSAPAVQHRDVDAREGASATHEQPCSLLHGLTRDSVRLIADHVISSHAPTADSAGDDEKTPEDANEASAVHEEARRIAGLSTSPSSFRAICLSLAELSLTPEDWRIGEYPGNATRAPPGHGLQASGVNVVVNVE